MARQGATMGKGALVVGLSLMVVALVALAAVSRFPSGRSALLAVPDSELAREAQALESSAAQYRKSAAEMLKAAHQRKTEAANVQAMEMYLHAAQSELKAYSANVEGLVTATDHTKLRADLSQFPKEAAELHALLDHSLGEADGAAVKIAQVGSSAVPLPRRAAAAAAKRAAAKQAALTGAKKQVATTHQQVLRATMPSPLQKMGKQHTKVKPQTNLDKVEATLKQLGAVKAFAREAAHGKARRIAASALLDNVKHAAAHGYTHVLQQQPAPLLGAMNVRDGELIDGDPKYKPSDVGLTKEDPEFVQKQNTLMPVYDPDNDKLLACDKKCQKEILHSALGITFKVATKCVPGCAKGDYTLHTQGKPLPEWQTAEELQEQDKFCDNDLVYMKCKWESLDPLCDKMTDFMPQYCLGHPNEGICQQCVKVEMYEYNEKKKFKEGCKKAQARRQDPMPEGCDAVLTVTSWQNSTSPEDMMKGVDGDDE